MNFTETSTRSGTARSSTPRTISLTPRRQSQAALHRQSFWRQHRRPDPPRQAVLLLRQRMGAHRAAHRHVHHRSHRSVPKVRPAQLPWADGCGHRRDLSRSPQAVPFYREMFSLTATPPERRSPCSAAPSSGRQRAAIAEWRRLRQPPERFAFQRRSRAGADSPHRLQHRRRKIRPGSASRPTPACRPHTPIPSTRCSTRSPLSRSIHSPRATPRLLARTSSTTSTPPSPGTKAFRAPRSRRPSRHFRSSCRAAAPTLLHYRRRPGQHLGAGPPRHALLHQRQSGLEPRPARIQIRHEHPHPPPQRLRFRRRQRPHRHLRHAAAIHLRSRLHRHEDFPLRANRALQLSESRSLRAGHLEAHPHADLDHRPPRHPQFESAQSPREIARLSGSFDSISHNVNQPLNAAIQTGFGHLSPPRRSRSCSPERRSPGNSSLNPCSEPASASSAISCPEASPMSSAPTRRT